jgi:hypothetical protein
MINQNTEILDDDENLVLIIRPDPNIERKPTPKPEKIVKKHANYKENYKEREKTLRYNNRSKDTGLSLEKLDLCDDIILILNDKIKNNQIQLTTFEEKTINKFCEKLKKSAQVPVEVKQTCFTGQSCIVWYCQFNHPDARKKECKCSIDTCDNLHVHQALCKNPKHSDNCTMAHRIQDLK